MVITTFHNSPVIFCFLLHHNPNIFSKIFSIFTTFVFNSTWNVYSFEQIYHHWLLIMFIHARWTVRISEMLPVRLSEPYWWISRYIGWILRPLRWSGGLNLNLIYWISALCKERERGGRQITLVKSGWGIKP